MHSCALILDLASRRDNFRPESSFKIPIKLFSRKSRHRSPSADEPYSPMHEHIVETEERVLLNRIGELLKQNLAEEALALQQQGVQNLTSQQSSSNLANGKFY